MQPYQPKKEDKTTKIEAASVKLGIIGNSMIQEGKCIVDKRCSGCCCMRNVNCEEATGIIGVQLLDFNNQHFNGLR